MTMSLVQTVTVGSGGASVIDFDNIPQDATDLCILISARSSATADEQVLNVELNKSGTNYSGRRLEGFGSGVQTNSFAQSYVGFIPAANTTSNTFSNVLVQIPNYSNTGSQKVLSADSVGENNATRAWQVITAISKSDAGAITSLRLTTSGNFTQHSSASLYKITKA